MDIIFKTTIYLKFGIFLTSFSLFFEHFIYKNNFCAYNNCLENNAQKEVKTIKTYLPKTP